MEAEQKKILISPLAYIKSIMYFQRFTSDYINEKEFKFAYGLLLGYVDDHEKTIEIEDFIPYKDYNKEYIIFEKYEKIFGEIEKLNVKYDEDEFPQFILGWARNSLYDNDEPTIFDKKNQILFQTAINPDGFFWIFDYENLAIGNGFELHAFKNDIKVINITSELISLRYEFSKDIYLDEIVQLAVDIEEKRKNNEILIKGLEEK